MKRKSWQMAAAVIISLLFITCRKEFPSCDCDDNDDFTVSVKVFASGLNNPRGLKFGPDGYLYVAEGGAGGTNSTVGMCTLVLPPVGPYTGSETGGRISRISPAGAVSIVTDKLPSSQTSEALGNLVSGVSDVAFIGNKLYALLAGAGCSHGVTSVPNGILRIKNDGSWEVVADLGAWQITHPVKNPSEGDFEPEGTWYSMVAVGGNLYALEPNQGELVKVTPGGDITRVIDISASQGHIVPTALAYNGNFFVGNLNLFPIVEGSSKIYKVTPGGNIQVWADDLTTVVGLDFDKRKRLYVLENTTGATEPTPGTGTIVRINNNGDKKIIVSDLSLPTAMTVGPDGKIYVSNWGFGPPAIGGGEILQIEIKCQTRMK